MCVCLSVCVCFDTGSHSEVQLALDLLNSPSECWECKFADMSFFPPFFKIVVKYIKTATEPFYWAWIFQTGQDLTMWPRLTAELSPPASASRRYMGFTHALPLWILFKQVLVLFFLGILFYFILFEKCGGLKIEPRIAFISLCGSPWLLFQSPKC